MDEKSRELLRKLEEKNQNLRSYLIIVIIFIVVILIVAGKVKYDEFVEKKLMQRDQEMELSGYNLCLQQVNEYFLSELQNKGYITISFNNESINLITEDTCREVIERVKG